MKKVKIFVTFLIIFSTFFVFGCESSTILKCAIISEATSVGSKNYITKITFLDDSRLNKKGVDIQVKFNKIGNIFIGKENEEKINYKIEEIDEWYSLTTIFAKAGDNQNEYFEYFENAIDKTYIWNYDGSIEVTLRVVVGDIEKNYEENGQILVGSEPISNQFVLKIK